MVNKSLPIEKLRKHVVPFAGVAGFSNWIQKLSKRHVHGGRIRKALTLTLRAMHAQRTHSALPDAMGQSSARALQILKQIHICVLFAKLENTRMKAQQSACLMSFLSPHKLSIWRPHAAEELVPRQPTDIGTVSGDITQTGQ